MQTVKHFFFHFILLCLPFVVQAQEIQSSKELLFKADSLYQKQLYTQSLTFYTSLLKTRKMYTPAMLLKMAYIQESAGNITEALYYLHLYYSRHPNKNTLKKMEDLARQHQISGFDYSDYDFFATQARKYYKRLLELMLMGAVVWVTLLILRKRKKVAFKPHTLVYFSVYLLYLTYYLNMLSFRQYAIIKSNNVPVMAGPSAGNKLLKFLPQASRVALSNPFDIWQEIEFNDTSAYVRKQNLLYLPD